MTRPKPLKRSSHIRMRTAPSRAETKKLLKSAEINAFLAHDDLEVSDEWARANIGRTSTVRALSPAAQRNFLRSNGPRKNRSYHWRSDVVIAPLSLDGTRSFGFISHLQSPRLPSECVTSEMLLHPLARRFRDISCRP